MLDHDTPSRPLTLAEIDDLPSASGTERTRLWWAPPEVERSLRDRMPMRQRFPWFCFEGEPGWRWFRLFGFGLMWKDSRCHRLLFSERHGKSCLRFGPWVIRPLRP
jgi:hypothetical protein